MKKEKKQEDVMQEILKVLKEILEVQKIRARHETGNQNI